MRYDTTLKTLFQAPPPQLLQLLVGGQAHTMLTVEYPTVQMRRPDLVVRLTDGRLYHLELQSTNDPAMPWRMLEYFGLLCQYYGQPPLQQVLYVGEALLTMPARLEYPTLAFQYEPIDIRTLDGATLLTSPSLEDNLLALLCRLQNPRGAVQHLLARIASLVGTARADALAKLVILAGPRRLGKAGRRGGGAIAAAAGRRLARTRRSRSRARPHPGWRAGDRRRASTRSSRPGLFGDLGSAIARSDFSRRSVTDCLTGETVLEAREGVAICEPAKSGPPQASCILPTIVRLSGWLMVHLLPQGSVGSHCAVSGSPASCWPLMRSSVRSLRNASSRLNCRLRAP